MTALGPLRLLVVQPTPFCNIDCRYCYLPNRSVTRKLPEATFRRLLRLAFDSPLGQSGFRLVWHGGEPLAAGIRFYDCMLTALQEENHARIPVELHIQTNATLIDDDWIALFRRHDIAIGISLDGPQALHDRHRVSRNGKGTFAQTMRGVCLLQEAGIPFDVIAVLTRDSLAYANDLIPFFADVGARSVGFNIEEIEDANAASSLNFSGVDAAFDAFYSALPRTTEMLARPMPLREIEDGFRRIAIGGAIMDDQREPIKILTCDCDGNLSTFSPELIGSPSAEYDNFIFGHVDSIDILEDLLKSPSLLRLHADIQRGVTRCKTRCSYFEACGGGAPGNKIFELGHADGDETLFCRLAIQAPTRLCLTQTPRISREQRADQSAMVT
ncbi:cyclophane-forming radical SAM/SPASM peptide maturase GrrM/OscB [Ferrovibrio terrae]|uniref:cyclophane-forming radical SAM/SPASM peptide maturase GrrM/OscB n=1 Tax=Ferrovibrio terrae TaxID=2594003 RepID=UPI0031378137